MTASINKKSVDEYSVTDSCDWWSIEASINYDNQSNVPFGKTKPKIPKSL